MNYIKNLSDHQRGVEITLSLPYYKLHIYGEKKAKTKKTILKKIMNQGKEDSMGNNYEN